MADSEVAVPVNQSVAEIETEAAGGADAPKVDSVAAVEDDGNPPGDRKRKLEDLEPHDEENEAPFKKQESSIEALNPNAAVAETGSGENITVTLALATEVNLENSESAVPKAGDSEDANAEAEAEAEAKEKNPDVEINGSVAAEAGKDMHTLETMTVGNGEVPPSESVQISEGLHDDLGTTSRKIEVPNNKVGVLIGKAGETIRYLQFNSGAKIQITRDAEADPHSTTRPVELIGSLESISKAEKLIKDVIAEADAGGSPSLVARGFSTIQSGGEQFEIKVPNEKVGLIIGKGGETIKNLQTRSGARIQLIPQHLPEGDASRERTVRITGDKKQIETAKEMIKEVMNQTPIKPSPLSGYNQQSYRPRAHTSAPHWGGRGAAPAQPNMGYDYQHRGNYPPQSSQYPQPYSGYSQQGPRGSYGGPSWDQQPSAPGHNNPSVGGYDYYSQGAATQASVPNPMSGPTGAPASYGQSQAPGYGHLAPYGGQSNPTQNYGHGYNDPRYDNQAPSQQFYGQQSMGSQPGVYGQGNAPQSGYGQQQPYAKSYGVPQDGPPYGVAPRAPQPGDPTYQGPVPASYAAGMPKQYPYGSNAPTQQAPSYNQNYGPSSGAMDGYAQPPPSAAYMQHGGQTAAPAYGQGGQPVAPYTQPNAQPGGYSQYPSSQQGYVDPATGNVNYGYQGGSSDAAYGAPPGSGYGSAPPAGGQPGYAQQPSNAAGYYDQSAAAPHSGYGSLPSKSVSPQPQAQPQSGYGVQYDSTNQMYAHH